MAKFRSLRITAPPMQIARALAPFPKKRRVLPLRTSKGSHSSLTYLPAVYAMAALGGRGGALNTKAGGLWQRAIVDQV